MKVLVCFKIRGLNCANSYHMNQCQNSIGNYKTIDVKHNFRERFLQNLKSVVKLRIAPKHTGKHDENY